MISLRNSLNNDEIKIMGVDPGSIKTGYGIIIKRRNTLSHITSGVIRAKATLSLSERLTFIYKNLVEIIDKYHPDVCALEDVFSSKYPKSGIYLGHARGVALLAVSLAEIPLFTYSPLIIKKIVAGYGGSSKKQVAKVVTLLLALNHTPAEDASDALAVSICHSFNKKLTP